MRIVARESPKIYHSSPLDTFLEIAPGDPAAFAKAKEQLKGRDYPRRKLVEALGQYQDYIGNDKLALQNVERLGEEGSYCVVTGQQLGFMGGPLYTILKGISCLLLAKKTNAIPVYWLATEDHDIDEIDHTYILNPLGNLRKFQLAFPKEGRFVEDLVLTEKNREVVASFFQACGLHRSSHLVEKPMPYAQFMASFLARLFAGTGMVFLEPRLLRPMAVPFFEKELREQTKIQEILKETTSRLIAAGGEATLTIGPGTNLFVKQEGIRHKIREEETEEMLKLLERDPSLFSTNAAARPVLQSVLLPVLAYVGGPSEISYHQQLRDYFRFQQVPMPWIVPRLSATFLPPFAVQLLEKCQIHPWDDFPAHWNQVFPSLEMGVDHVVEDWDAIASHYFKEDLVPESIHRYVRQGVRQLTKRVVKARLKRREIPYYGLHYLHNLIHPHHQPQDRLLNWWGFQAQYDKNLVQELLNQASDSSFLNSEHLYCYL